MSEFSSSDPKEATYWLLSTIPSLLPLTTNTHEYRWNHLQFLNHLQHMLPPRIHKEAKLMPLSSAIATSFWMYVFPPLHRQ